MGRFLTSCTGKAGLRILSWLVLLSLPVAAQPAPNPTASDSQILKALNDKSFKVRLQGAILAGKKKVARARPALVKLIQAKGEKEAIVAAAAVALGQLGDQEARAQLGPLVGHRSPLVAKAADKALRTLDRALPSPPYFLISVGEVSLPKGVGRRPIAVIVKRIQERLATTGGAVAAFGEDRVLSEKELATHLERRKLSGVELRPALMELSSRAEGGRTTLAAKVEVHGFDMQKRNRMLSAGGEAESWMDGEQLTKDERIELEDEVLRGATDSATVQALQLLSSQ